MTALEFRTVLDGLGLNQRSFARLCGSNERTVRRWASGEQDIPDWVDLVTWLLHYAPRVDVMNFLTKRASLR